MTDKNKLTEDLQHFEKIAAKDYELIQKLNEFIILLDNSKIDTENIKSIQSKINTALEKKIKNRDLIKEIKEVSIADLDKMQQLDQLEQLLLNNHLDSRQTKKIKYSDGIIKVVKILIGFLFVTLGFAMIVMPAPPYFEMFTIFHFTVDDGFTLMDLISLIVIAVGIYVVLKTAYKSKSYE